MKRTIIPILILLLMVSLPLFAGGQPENASWYLPDTAVGANGSYYDLSIPNNEDGFKLVQIGSTILRSGGNPVTISQEDTIIGAEAGKFYFIHDDNPTAIYPYTLKYKVTSNSRIYIGVWDQSQGNLTDYKNNAELKLAQAGRNWFGTATTYFQYADFYLNYALPGSFNAIESGTYTSHLKITFYNSIDSSSTTTADSNFSQSTFFVTLQAKYMTNIDGSVGGFSDFYFSIEPTPASYNIDLVNQAGQDIKIADLTFTLTSTSNSDKTDYGANPFQIGICANNSIFSGSSADEYRFVKRNIQNQELSDANSVRYSVKFTNTNPPSGYAITNPLETGTNGYTLKHTATHTTDHQKVAASTYYDRFDFTGEVSIKITGDPSNLSSGQYSTTLYYYIISNN